MHPVWSPAGDELYYWWDDAVHAVSLAVDDDAIVAERPERLFDHEPCDLFFRSQFSATTNPDGDARFLLLTPEQKNEPDEDTLRLIVHWFSELDALDAAPP